MAGTSINPSSGFFRIRQRPAGPARALSARIGHKHKDTKMQAIAKKPTDWRLVVGVPLVTILVAAGGYGIMMLWPAPANLDYSLTRTSEQGSFVASLETGPIALNRPQTWTVDVDMTDGKPIDIGALTIDGGMPLHGHGLPAEPKVVRALGDGRFEVSGVLFSMPGWWTVTVHVSTPTGPDAATFNFKL
jgi:hypothetical protein